MTESPIVLSVQTMRPFTAKEIGYILCGAFESDMTPWINRVQPVVPEGVVARTTDVIWYVDEPYIADPQFAFTINYDSEDDDEGDFTGMKTIRLADITTGLAVMAAKYPNHWSDLINDECSLADAVTYDVAMQCIVLGDVIYG